MVVAVSVAMRAGAEKAKAIVRTIALANGVKLQPHHQPQAHLQAVTAAGWTLGAVAVMMVPSVGASAALVTPVTAVG